MDTTIKFLGAGIGFLVIMTAASMAVATLVRLIHYFNRTRGKNVAEMLASLNLGFRMESGDVAWPGDTESVQFVDDVLRDPILQSPAGLVAQGKTGATSASDLKLRTQRLLERIDYVPVHTVLQVVSQRSRDGRLPATWHRNLSAERATPGAFRKYITRTFLVAEGTSIERFRTQSKRLVSALSLLFVVAFGFNTVELVPRLYGSQVVHSLLETRARDLLDTAEQTGLSDAPAQPVDDRALLGDVPLAEALSIFNEPQLGFGWQRSSYYRERCARDPACAAELGLLPLSPKSDLEKLWDTTIWLSGFLISWMLLSLGAPFWSDRLREALNLRNAVQQRMTRKSR